MDDVSRNPREWVAAFERAVQTHDIDSARSLFSSDAIAFGTWAFEARGLDQIVEQQWRNVWPRLRTFRFSSDCTVRCAGSMAWVASVWQSEVLDTSGHLRSRPGRATIVLEQLRDGRWLAMHSHFSLPPDQSERVHGTT